MPEKPEVITVVESLKTKILGRRITGCNVYWENIIDQVINLFDDLHNTLLSNYYRGFKKKYIA